MWRGIEEAISAATGKGFRVESRRELGGGCINEAVCLEGMGQRYFIKLNRADLLHMFEAEAAGLEAIMASGSVRVPRPLCRGVEEGRSWLALEFIPMSSPGAAAAAALGEQLAAMHRCSQDAFGWDRDNTIGATPQPNTRDGSWMSFLRDRRLGFQLELAATSGAPRSLIEAGSLLLESLEYFFQDYSPRPSLLHGDLWGGNWAVDEAGAPVIFDPAVYYGDRETDIAMTELFGGFDKAFYRAYRRAWPLHPGYESRRDLYQLYHILNHFNLFGGGYAGQAQHLIDRLLAQVGVG